MRKVLNIITNTIFILVILVLISYFALRSIGLIEIYQVQTGSMEDGIHAGDYILITKKKSYQIGDIVTYRSGNYFITHRIIKQNGNKVVTKGDANNTADKEIDTSNIVGKVLKSGGVLNIIIDYKFLIVGILLTVYLISYCLDNKNKSDKKKIKPV